MKAYIGDEAGGAAVVVGVKDGEVKVAKSVTLRDDNIRDPKIVERAYWLRFAKGLPKGWRRVPEYDDFVN
ncbi:MAG TPA: hypothetical protein VE439_01680 [Anaerolineae bacterium]|nr:hypothetical protein [Anaerolineae bacterium]